jgi:hypothetical protein
MLVNEKRLWGQNQHLSSVINNEKVVAFVGLPKKAFSSEGLSDHMHHYYFFRTDNISGDPEIRKY